MRSKRNTRSAPRGWGRPRRLPRPGGTDMDNSVASLLRELIAEIGQLLRQELRLARAETGEKLAQAQHGIIAIAVGLFIAFAALLILLQAVVIALAQM